MRENLADDPLLALGEPDNLADPYPAYRRMREHDPVRWHEGLGSWLLTRHADCSAVLRDSVSFGSDFRRVGEETPAPLLSIQSLDPPEHTVIRHFVADAFRAQDFRAQERSIAERTRRGLAALGEGPADLVAGLAEPIALGTIVEFLGIPAPDPEWFVPMSHTIADGMDAGLWPETDEPAVRARAELAELAGGWLDDPPAHGLVGYVASRELPPGLERAVLLNSLRALLHAGFESCARMLGNALAALLALPGGVERWRRADRARAVDELIRFDAPVQADARVCVAAATVGGTPIEPGQVMTLLLGAANRDPARFGDPDEIRFDRAPNPHLGFGRGAHACVGSALAALQARVVFDVLAEERPGTTLAAPPRFRRNLTLRGPYALDVELR